MNIYFPHDAEKRGVGSEPIQNEEMRLKAGQGFLQKVGIFKRGDVAGARAYQGLTNPIQAPCFVFDEQHSSGREKILRVFFSVVAPHTSIMRAVDYRTITRPGTASSAGRSARLWRHPYLS